MTARQFAEHVGVKVVGKLTRKTKEFTNNNLIDYKTGECIVEKHVYWIDEAGNEFHKERGSDGWCIVTADGGVI